LAAAAGHGADHAEGILRNLRANGGTVFEVGMDEERGEAIVSRLLRPDVMVRYGIRAEQAERF
jgi:hypothetical protein